MTRHAHAHKKTQPVEVVVNEAIPADFSGSADSLPMHPEVRWSETGDRPKCSLQLVLDGSSGRDRRGYNAHTSHHAESCTAVEAGSGEGRHDKPLPGFEGAACTCPVRAEAEQAKPGSCPICGMGLELEPTTMVDDGSNLELTDFTRQFRVGTVLTIPLLILTLSPFFGADWIREMFGGRTTLWIGFAVGTPVILWSGWPSASSVSVVENALRRRLKS